MATKLDTHAEQLSALGHPVRLRILRFVVQAGAEGASAGDIQGHVDLPASTLSHHLKRLVDEKAAVIRGWVAEGKLSRVDPYHLIFSIWATTQHYADFDVQVRAVLGPDRNGEGRFDDAARYLEQLFMHGLVPRG